MDKEQIRALLESVADVDVSISEEKEMEWLFGVTMVFLDVYLKLAKRLSFVDEQNEVAMLAFFGGCAEALIDGAMPSGALFEQMRAAMRDEGYKITTDQLGEHFSELLGKKH